VNTFKNAGIRTISIGEMRGGSVWGENVGHEKTRSGTTLRKVKAGDYRRLEVLGGERKLCIRILQSMEWGRRVSKVSLRRRSS